MTHWKNVWQKTFFFFNVYFWERDTQSTSRGGAERERGGHRIWSRFQALSCHPRAWGGLELMNHEIVTWVKVRHLTDWATQAPFHFYIKKKKKKMWIPLEKPECAAVFHASVFGLMLCFLSPQGKDAILPFSRPSSNIPFSVKPVSCPQILPLLCTL